MRNWIYLLLLLPLIGSTQNPLLDSLQQRLGNPPTTLHEIDTWLGLARLAVFDGDFDRVEECTNRAFQLSEQENYLAGKAKALLYQSQAKGQKGATEESLMLIQQGLELARQSGDPSTLLLAQYQLAEDYLYNKNQDVKALEILTKATEIDGTKVSPKTLGNAYKNIGQCYLHRKQLEQAEQAFFRALGYLERPYIDPNLGIVSATEIDNGKLNTGQLYLYLLDAYDSLEEHDKAIDMGEKALALYQELEVKSCIAWAYEELAYLKTNIGDLERAIQYLQAATKTYEVLDASKNLANVYADFGLVYEYLNDFDQSLRSIKKALFYAEQTTDSILLIDIHLKVGQTYNTLGDWDKALPYLQNALSMSKTLQDSSEFVIIYSALARVEAGKGNKDQAVEYLKAAIYFGKVFNRQEVVLGCLYALTSVYFDVEPQQVDSAAHYALEGIEMLKEVQDIYYEKDLMSLYSEIQAAKGNFEEALAYHKSYFQLHDSIYTQDAQAVLREEQVRQNVQEYQAQQEAASLRAELLTSQNRFYLTLLIALLLVLLIGGYLFYQVRKSKQVIESKNGELEKLNQTKDKFFGIIAHDIRSPILALENVGSQMDYYLEKGKTEKLKQLSNRIDNTAKRVTNLLDNLLNWALLQQGIVPHHPNTLALNEIVKQNIEMFQMSANLKEIKLESQLTEVLKVVADESALNTILRNLISNAIKFTPKGGKVAVMANSLEGQVLLKVQDSGIGMSAEQVNNIFALNKKSKKGTVGERGTGLGLVLCKELVDLNQGTISVESQPEKGSDFSVTLPLAA